MDETTKAIGHIPELLIESLKRGTNYFLGIGINKYQNYSRLNNAVKDIQDVANVLLQDYYFEQKNIRFLLEEEATRENIIEELHDLPGKLKTDDRILIYYSGHGKMDGELGYWVPFDAKRDRRASLINNSEVQAIVRTIKARHILLISDSCFSGSLLSKDARLAEGAFNDFEKNSSRFVFSSGKGEVSDGIVGSNSPFADAILKDLKTNEEAINIVLLADQVTKRVRFNYAQKAECAPMFQSGHDGGQFVFFKRQTEKDRWLSAFSQNTEAGYLKYLDEYPNGQFSQQAEQNMLDLADEKAWKIAMKYDAAFSYRTYLQKFPAGKHSAQAREIINDVLFKEDKDINEAFSNEAKRISRIESERFEKERLAKIEADKIEKERLAKIEVERLEKERLEKIKANIIEHDRQTRIKADRLEKDRLAKIEANIIEHERLSKIEADRIEKEHQSRIKANISEHERLSKIEAERIEQEHLMKIEANTIEHKHSSKNEADETLNKYFVKYKTNSIKSNENEHERLERSEAEKVENERLASIEANIIERKRQEMFNKNRIEKYLVENIEIKFDKFETAGFWMRFLALIIDTIIILIFSIIAISLLNYNFDHYFDSYYNNYQYCRIEDNIWNLCEVYIHYCYYYPVLILIPLVYFIPLQSSNVKASLGQLLFKIKLVSLDGNNATFLQVTGRFFCSILSAALFGIGYIMFFFTEKKQTLHDLLAGTTVVKNYKI